MARKNNPNTVEEREQLSMLSMPSKPEKKMGCCMGSHSCAPSEALADPVQAKTPFTTSSEAKKGPKTRITVKYDIGFGNQLYLRGKGASLSWDKGVVLKNEKSDEWIWETDQTFTSCEFKVLINDMRYETGDNHTLTCGASMQYTPKF